MTMKIVPIYREDSQILGNAQVNTRAVTYIEKNKDLLYLPSYDEKGRIIALRAVKGELCTYETCWR